MLQPLAQKKRGTTRSRVKPGPATKWPATKSNTEWIRQHYLTLPKGNKRRYYKRSSLDLLQNDHPARHLGNNSSFLHLLLHLTCSLGKDSGPPKGATKHNMTSATLFCQRSRYIWKGYSGNRSCRWLLILLLPHIHILIRGSCCNHLRKQKEVLQKVKPGPATKWPSSKTPWQ